MEVASIVIPARLASTRLPRKMLLNETGKPLVQHTYEAAVRSKRATEVIVAADCEAIATAVERFGGRVELTRPECASGTDRVAEVARRMPHVDIFVNVQGDEPEIAPEAIDRVIELLACDPSAVMSTAAAPIRSREKLDDPACVKVVFDAHQRAIYFSRSAIPFARQWHDALLEQDPAHFYQHMGLYAYRREFLLQIANLPPVDIERLESLEQLRVLHAGYPIKVGVVERASSGIDTPEDYQAFVERCRAAQQGSALPAAA